MTNQQKYHKPSYLVGLSPLFTADQMRAYADATCAMRAQADSQPVLPKITAEDRSLLHYNPNTDDIVEWVQHYASAAITADRAMRAAQPEGAQQPGTAYAVLPEIDRVIGRLASSDPDFPDCEDAVVLLRKYRKLCQEIGRGDSHHLDRIEKAAIAVESRAPHGQAPAQAEPAISAGDAVFAFASMLTALPHVIPFGAAAWATPGVELATAFNAANGFSVSQNFPDGLVFPKITGDLLAVVETAAEPVAQGDALNNTVRVPLDSLHADAAYLIGRLQLDTMDGARVVEIIRERIEAAKAALAAQAQEAAPVAQGDAEDAARYRWLRARWGRIADEYDGDSDQLVAIRESDSHFEGWDVDPASLDRAIDAARSHAKEGASHE